MTSYNTAPAERHLTSRWDSEVLREYFVQLARGHNFIAHMDQFPNAVALDSGTHAKLNRMASRTRLENREYWSAIGSGARADTQRSVYMSQEVPGKEGCVPGDIIDREHGYLTQQDNPIVVLGDVHTHPSGDGSPSVGDMYRMLTPRTHPLVTGVVSEQGRFFAFRTQETDDLDIRMWPPEHFKEYMYRMNGYRYDGTSDNGELATPVVANPTPNLYIAGQIAARHGLVLYGGAPNDTLHRLDLPLGTQA